MPSPISRRPAGLLDLLLTQQQGENPNDLLESVQPTLDLLRFYAPDRMEVAGTTLTHTGVGSNGSIEVPAGQTWLTFGVASSVTFATVNQRISCSCRLNNIVSNPFWFTALGGVRTPVGATDVSNEDRKSTRLNSSH